MDNLENCDKKACCWAYRHELLGIILLVLATILTIVTGNGFGIFAMFIAGICLCCYKHICCHIGHDHTNTPMCNSDDQSTVNKVIK
jgi:hypothetical protein